MDRRLAIPLLLAATAAALFAAWMNPAILDPRNIGWLLDGNDRGQSAIGMAAYLAGGAWPALHDPLLAAPEGTSVLLTDSIPLLMLVLGPLAGLLPDGWQYIGLWLLLCCILQTGFAWALVRPYAPDDTTAWRAAALLAAAPVLINRYGHPSLCAQWLVLWALWIHADPLRNRRALWWLAVIAAAALVHAYLLLMVLAVWGGSLLERLAKGGRLRALAEAAAGLAPAIAILHLEGVTGGGLASTGTYGGRFAMALDAWINPANPAFTALLPSSPQRDGRGFEGLQYLGAGMILAVAMAVAMSLARGRLGSVNTAGAVPGFARYGWLLPGFAVLGVVAVGPNPHLWGEPLAQVALPRAIIDALDPVRAAGRLFWPATYALGFVAIRVLLRAERARLLLGIALAVQLIDLAPMFRAVHATSAAASDRQPFHRLRDPRWTALIAAARRIDFQPADIDIDLALMEEITWRAVQARRPVGFTYTSRMPAPTAARLARERALFLAGQVAPGHLVILLDGKAPAALAGRIERIDGVAFIRPAPSGSGEGFVEQPRQP